MSVSIYAMSDSKWEQAEKKANDIHMTVNGNPLRETPDLHCCLVRKNMQRLEADARAWSDQRSGEAYRAIRGMTLTNGE